MDISSPQIGWILLVIVVLIIIDDWRKGKDMNED